MQQNERASDDQAVAEAFRDIRRATSGELFVGVRTALGGKDVTLAQLATLLLLTDRRPRPVKEIAERLGRSMSATSRMLDNLVRARLIKRREDTEDRRVRLVAIAAAGEKLVERLMDTRARSQIALMDLLTAEERAAVVRGISLLAEAARRRGDER